jgi:hypothetical protein
MQPWALAHIKFHFWLFYLHITGFLNSSITSGISRLKTFQKCLNADDFWLLLMLPFAFSSFFFFSSFYKSSSASSYSTEKIKMLKHSSECANLIALISVKFIHIIHLSLTHYFWVEDFYNCSMIFFEYTCTRAVFWLNHQNVSDGYCDKFSS